MELNFDKAANDLAEKAAGYNNEQKNTEKPKQEQGLSEPARKLGDRLRNMSSKAAKVVAPILLMSLPVSAASAEKEDIDSTDSNYQEQQDTEKRITTEDIEELVQQIDKVENIIQEKEKELAGTKQAYAENTYNDSEWIRKALGNLVDEQGTDEYSKTLQELTTKGNDEEYSFANYVEEYFNATKNAHFSESEQLPDWFAESVKEDLGTLDDHPQESTKRMTPEQKENYEKARNAREKIHHVIKAMLEASQSRLLPDRGTEDNDVEAHKQLNEWQSMVDQLIKIENLTRELESLRENKEEMVALLNDMNNLISKEDISEEDKTKLQDKAEQLRKLIADVTEEKEGTASAEAFQQTKRTIDEENAQVQKNN